MITHYDMISGEMIRIDGQDTLCDTMAPIPEMPALRLMSVREATLLAPPADQPHPAVVMQPIASLLPARD